MTQRIPRKLHEQVFDSIKDMIRSGALEQGELLPSENKLAQQLGVSRVTVRWALKQLAEAGIIQTRRGKGSIVAVDWKGLLEEGELHDQAEQLQATFFQSTRARWLIEPTVARQAALLATVEDLARMEEALLRREDELVLAPPDGPGVRAGGLPHQPVGLPPQPGDDAGVGGAGRDLRLHQPPALRGPGVPGRSDGGGPGPAPEDLRRGEEPQPRVRLPVHDGALRLDLGDLRPVFQGLPQMTDEFFSSPGEAPPGGGWKIEPSLPGEGE